MTGRTRHFLFRRFHPAAASQGDDVRAPDTVAAGTLCAKSFESPRTRGIMTTL